MEVGEHNLSPAYQLIFRPDRLFHLHNHLSRFINRLDCRENLCACGTVFVVGESRAVARRSLYIHPVACRHHFTHSRRRHRHTVLIVFDFFGDSDNHGNIRF